MSSSPAIATETSAVPRRVSGRVRKQPDTYGSGSKRKRIVEDDDGEDQIMSDGDSSPNSESSDNEASDAEESWGRSTRARKTNGISDKRAAPRKAAPKRVKVDGASLPFRSAVKRPMKRRAAVPNKDAENMGGLYARIFAGTGPVDAVAAQWIQEFQSHESRALADVVNFVLACAGCAIKVTEEDIEDADCVSSRLTDIQDEFQASGPTDYHLIVKGKAGEAFKHRMTEFITALIQSIAATGLLYENPALIENIQVWFSTLSSAASRAFRHTSTFASLCVMTSLCSVGHEIAQELAAKQRQAETERKKSKPNKNRVRDIEARAKEASDNAEFIEVQLKDWFDVLFIHRYRDVDPAIRRDCMAALGSWIDLLPDVFFDGQHLRYLGWMLSDPSAATRGEVVKQLQRLYKHNSAAGGLKTFTERFRPRLVEIATSDADATVRTSGIELLELLRKDGLLEPDDIDAVGRLIYDSDLNVRKSVANFFAENVYDLYNSKIDELGGLEGLQEALPNPREANSDTPRLTWLKYKCLVEMLMAYDVDESLQGQLKHRKSEQALLRAAVSESRFTLAADALYSSIQEIQDWQALSGFLLYDHDSTNVSRNGPDDDILTRMKEECALQDQEEAILLQVVNASVRRKVTDMSHSVTATSKKLVERQRQRVLESQEDLVRHLTELIPKLLKKFGGSSSTSAAVLKLENVLNIPSLAEHRLQPADHELLDGVRKQFMSHGTDEVLGPASDVILHAKSYQELDELADGDLSGLWEDVIDNLTELLKSKQNTVRGTMMRDELLALSNNLLRVVRLAEVSNCVLALEGMEKVTRSAEHPRRSPVDHIIELIQRAIPTSDSLLDAEDAALEDEIAGRAAKAALRYMQWKFSRIRSAVTSPTGPDFSFEELEDLAGRRDTYADNMQSVIRKRKAADEVSTVMIGLMLDLAVSAKTLLMIQPRPGASDEYTFLAVPMKQSFSDSVMKIFGAVESDFAALSGKRVQSSSNAGDPTDIDADPVDDEPLSDAESSIEHHEPTQSQAASLRKETHLRDTMIAERKLCELTRSIIFAVHAGVLDANTIRRRLERNKSKLGANFKEMLAYLDVGKAVKTAKGKGRPKANASRTNGTVARSKARPDPKSNAIVADDETDDEIEVDDDDERESPAGDSNGIADPPEDESVLGD